jgi:hypothetical protein
LVADPIERVEHLRLYARFDEVYNFEVEDLSCYAVGRSGILVHNTNTGEGVPKSGGPDPGPGNVAPKSDAPATSGPQAAPAAGAFNPAGFVGQQAITSPHLPAGVRPALVIDGKVYVARKHSEAWALAGKRGVEQFYGFAEIDATGKVARLIK